MKVFTDAEILNWLNCQIWDETEDGHWSPDIFIPNGLSFREICIERMFEAGLKPQ